jgi:hypothetical protein
MMANTDIILETELEIGTEFKINCSILLPFSAKTSNYPSEDWN